MVKFSEIIQASEDKALFEELDASNDSGFSTEDLVKIVKTANTPCAGEMSSDEFTEYMRINVDKNYGK